jgi:hypothetical protein
MMAPAEAAAKSGLEAAASPPLLEWGLGAAVAILVLERVYVLVKMILENTNKRTEGTAAYGTMVQQVHDLHDWHNVTDEEGVRLWYSRRSVERAVEKIAESQVTQTKLLENLARVVETQASTASEMQRTLADLYTNMTTHTGDTCPFRASSTPSKSEG